MATTDTYAQEALAKRIQKIQEERSRKPPRKKVPPKLAVINQSGCTGCEACIVFCPVDCIELVPGAEHAQFQQVVEVDLNRCIGCALCSKHCPWDTIPMMPTQEALERAPSLTLKSVCGQKIMDSA